jgi:hypothetical protein
VRICLPLTSSGVASIGMNAMTAGTKPLLTQVCIVPRWTTTSLGFRWMTSPLSSSQSISPRQQQRVVHGFRCGA